MKRKALTVLVTLAVMSMLFAGVTRADVPAPPANQDLGILDGIFNNLTEESVGSVTMTRTIPVPPLMLTATTCTMANCSSQVPVPLTAMPACLMTVVIRNL